MQYRERRERKEREERETGGKREREEREREREREKEQEALRTYRARTRGWTRVESSKNELYDVDSRQVTLPREFAVSGPKSGMDFAEEFLWYDTKEAGHRKVRGERKMNQQYKYDNNNKREREKVQNRSRDIDTQAQKY